MIQYYAQRADAVIVIAGLTCEEEGEYDETGGQSGGDRDSLELNRAEREMIEAAAEANANTIVCLQGGGIVLTSSWEKYVKAILIQWYSGMEGGNALARILFGVVNPSAKLPVTIPASAQQLPFYHQGLEEIKYDFYHGYFLVDKRGETASYPFGYGLSYTSFSYKNLFVQTKGNDVIVSVDVTNTGERAGERNRTGLRCLFRICGRKTSERIEGIFEDIFGTRAYGLRPYCSLKRMLAVLFRKGGEVDSGKYYLYNYGRSLLKRGRFTEGKF